MELQKAIDILMTLHRYKLGKADKPTCTEADINTARNVLMHYNNLQRTIVAGRTTGVVLDYPDFRTKEDSPA